MKEDLVDVQIEKLFGFGRQLDKLTFIPSSGLLESPLSEEYEIKGGLREEVLKIDREFEKKIKILHSKHQAEIKKLLNSRDSALKEALGKDKATKYDDYFGKPFVRALEIYMMERRWQIKKYSRKHEGYKN